MNSATRQLTPGLAEARTLVSIGRLEDFPDAAVRLVVAGGRRLAVVRHGDGVLVVDNACPHQAYGLVQGSVRRGSLVCAWHNWTYRLTDGRCEFGEEDLSPYPVAVVDGEVLVDLAGPPRRAERARRLESLRRGIEEDYVGQIAREVVRLLREEADPVELVWEAVAWGAPRAEFGFGHSMAMLVDCLDLARRAEGDARALPVVQAIAAVAESERRRPLRPQPAPLLRLPRRPGAAFAAALEAAELEEAEGLLRGALHAGTDLDEVRRWLVGAAAAHHLSYGHGAIYVQKAFELLGHLGAERADAVLPHLVPALGHARREDLLPYMRSFMRELAHVDLAAVADAQREPGWSPPDRLRRALLGGDRAEVVRAAQSAAREGGGVDGLLDAVSAAASERLLRYDPRPEVESVGRDFGWLDVSHTLTLTAAARWAWASEPGPAAARLAFFAAFLVSYAGRPGYVALPAELVDAAAPAPAELATAALSDRAGSLIMSAHLVKTSAAAVREAAATGAAAPLAAAARLLEGPRRDRFVTLEVRKAIDVADGRVPA